MNETNNESTAPRIRRMSPEVEAQLRKQMQEQMARAQDHAEHAPARFLKAWLRGVRIAGKNCFGFQQPIYGDTIQPAQSLDEVTSKWQVCPILDVVEKVIGVKSSGERTLLAVMYSFYNTEDGAKLMDEVGIRGFADIASSLDLEARDVVAELLKNYTGW